MRPYEFSLENALELLSDGERRVLTKDARACAESGGVRVFGGGTYWEKVLAEHRRIVWLDAYQKRRARIERLASNNCI